MIAVFLVVLPTAFGGVLLGYLTASWVDSVKRERRRVRNARLEWDPPRWDS